jgi:hypothetical protein
MVTGPSFSQAVTGSANYTFNYRIAAVGPTGDSAQSAIASVPTISPAPGTLVGTALSASEVQLTWADRSADELGFRVEMWNYPTQTWIIVGDVGPGVTTVNVTGARSKTIYSFRVRAYTSTWQTQPSNMSTVTTL